MIWKKAIILLAVAAAAAIPLAAEAACESAEGLSFICGLTNAEDLVAVPGTPWIIASGLAEGAEPGGHLYLVNESSHAVDVLLPGSIIYRQDQETFGACPGKPDATHLSAHGLGLRPGLANEHTLYVVAHGAREAVEVFTVKAGTARPELTWIGCVPYPASAFGNGVAALPDNGFAATKFLATDDPKAIEKLMAGEPEGGVFTWRPKRGWEKVPDAGTISADNGIAASPDGKWLFVAGSGDSTVVRLSLAGKSEDQAVIRTDFHTDNLRWGSDGYLYAAGARDSLANLMACAPNTARRCSSPFSVLRIDPATMQTQEVLRHPGSAAFGAASTALRVGDEIWLATPHGDRIAIAPVK